MIRIGIDLGGTKTEAIAMDAQGLIRERQRIATPRDYDACIRAIAGLMTGLESGLDGPARVGVGHPGSINPDNQLIRNANSTWLNGRPLAADLSAALDRDVRTANDADCFALSEAADGAGQGCGVVFGVIAGTGLGGGIVINGALLSGGQGIAGEWGHTPLPWPQSSESPGPDCWCGLSGCLETWLSGPGLSRDHKNRTGRTLDAEEIFAAAAAGEPDAQASTDLYVDRFARGLTVITNILDPDVIVLGGGVSNAPGLAERIETALPARVFSDVVHTRVVRNQHGDSSGVRGAAWLWSAA